MEVIIRLLYVKRGPKRVDMQSRTSTLIIYLVHFCLLSQNRLRGSGHGIAAARMDAKLNTAGWMSEKMGGFRFEY